METEYNLLSELRERNAQALTDKLDKTFCDIMKGEKDAIVFHNDTYTLDQRRKLRRAVTDGYLGWLADKKDEAIYKAITNGKAVL